MRRRLTDELWELLAPLPPPPLELGHGSGGGTSRA